MKNNSGVALVELLVVMALLSVVFSLTFINFSGLLSSSSQTSNIDLLISDLKSQQIQAMSGNTVSPTTNDSYGIYFEQGSYTLFRGLTYSGSDPQNLTINLEPQIQFTNLTLPDSGSSLVFLKGSGDIYNYSTIPEVTITVRDTTSNYDYVIKLNKHGVTY